MLKYEHDFVNDLDYLIMVCYRYLDICEIVKANNIDLERLRETLTLMSVTNTGEVK